MSNPIQTQKSRQISSGYQVIIIAGFIILFLQLFSLAKSLFDNSMLQKRIDDFREQKTSKSDAISAKQLEYFASMLKNQQIADLKRTKSLVYLDEEEHRIPNSTYLANQELTAPNEDPIFKDQNEELKEKSTPEYKIIEDVSKRSLPEQWLFMLFHLY